jgi:predicted DNA binding CopG/RHH family protein
MQGGASPMKVVKADKKFRSVTLRLPEEVMLAVDKIADKEKLSRQQLIAAILEQVLTDDKFVLKVGP